MALVPRPCQQTDTLFLQGPPNVSSLKRTFGQPGEPKVKLYRCRLHVCGAVRPVLHKSMCFRCFPTTAYCISSGVQIPGLPTSHTMPTACCRDSAAWCPYCESCNACGFPCCLAPALCLPSQTCLLMMILVAESTLNC